MQFGNTLGNMCDVISSRCACTWPRKGIHDPDCRRARGGGLFVISPYIFDIVSNSIHICLYLVQRHDDRLEMFAKRIVDATGSAVECIVLGH